MKEQIIYNGEMLDAGTAIVQSASPGSRYGEGCFETMRLVNGRIPLREMHFERLFSSAETLGFTLPGNFTATALEAQVISLVQQNNHYSNARVRLSVFKKDGDSSALPQYIIETTRLESDTGKFNDEGLIVDVFKDERKNCDSLSYIKSNNFLKYALAAEWAKQHRLDDAVLLNSAGRIADTTIANIFIVQDGIIKTPALSEGCIAGVMRRYVISWCRKESIPLKETMVTTDDLQNAGELFLTNAIRGIRWVKQAGDAGYPFRVSEMLYQQCIKPLWE